MSERGTPTIGTTGAVRAAEPISASELGRMGTLPAATGSGAIAPADRVGRFVITGVLGAGGMGEVYAARDPELDRQVAIKVLRPDLLTRADTRLRREARAMARLSHPNLVAVHEVGVHAGQLFIAMELVAGTTLRTWAVGKSWREIVRVYRAAGRGLAAAHEAGIVHRDFKPDNVLVGTDGRVAVSDFGLALTDEPDVPDGPDGEPPAQVDEDLTQAGTLLGTLRYMAPEQLERRGADARSDQFAFCVSLWEALDAHPFDPARTARSSDACRDAIAAGVPRPKLRGVPRRITRTLLRGLSTEARDRWFDMPALLAQLDGALARRARIAVGAIGLGAIGVAISATWVAREPAVDPCAGVTGELATIWQPSDHPRIAAAFATTGRANAADATTRVTGLLDRRAAEWAAMRVATCVAAKADGDQRRELHARQAACMQTQLHELDALVTGLTTRPSGEVVDRSIRVATELAPVSDCANVDALLEHPAPPPDPAIGARIDRLTQTVARAKVRDALTGDVSEIQALQTEAAALRWDPLIAETGYLAGQMLFRRGENQPAERTLRDAAIAAARAHDDALVVESLGYVAQVVGDQGRPKEALEIAQASELAAARAGSPVALQIEVALSLAEAYQQLTQFDDSDREYARAVALLERSQASPSRLAATLNNWSNELEDRSDYARSVPMSDRAVALMREALGDHHPDLARILQSNGNKQLAIRNYALAKQRFEEALAIKEAVYGPSDPTVAMTVHSLGNFYTSAPPNDLPRAQKLYERARDIWLAKAGPANGNVLMARFNLGVNLKRQGRFTEALAELEAVLAIRQATPETSQLKVANTLEAIAEVEVERGNSAVAIDHAQRALAIREKVAGPETSDVADSLSVLATLWSATDCAKARPFADRAIAVLAKQPNGDRGSTKAGALAARARCALRDGQRDVALAGLREAIAMVDDEPGARAGLELELATALWATDRAAARTLATSARTGDPVAAERWLAAHR